MKKSLIFAGVLSACMLCSCATTTAPVTPAAKAPPSPAEMQAAFEKSSKVGPEHALLKQLVGTWKADVKWWIDPNGKAEVSTGKSVNTPALGGRFIREEYNGKMMGQPFQGIGFLGFDNVTKQYTSSWIDSMSTTMMTGTGSFDEATKSWSYASSFSCPLSNSKREVKSVTRLIDKNSHVFEMYDLTPEGTQFKTLEITYKRLK